MTTILVPDPSLVLLVGAAGAGKSTFAARHFAPDEILSSDAYRALVSGDEANQGVSHVAFRILHGEVERRLAGGRLTVVDATNVSARNRATLIRRGYAARTPVVAVVLALPEPVVLARNAARARRVDEQVIRDQLRRVTETVGDGVLAGEGCAAAWILRSPEAVETVTIARLPVTGVAPISPSRPPPTR